MFSHTFVICAYKESKYLESCIHSLLKQTIKSHIIICTSTPCDYIKNIAYKYSIPYYVNNRSGIGIDWNFAYQKAQTRLVTISHQDDIYFPNYLETILKYDAQNKDAIIFFTNYKEIRHNKLVNTNTLLKIKHLMNYPLKFRLFYNIKWIRKFILSLGNPICCPAVTFNKIKIGNTPFNENLRNSLDWEAWIRFANRKGSYIYIDKKLMAHRISEDSTTTQVIANGTRTKEDLAILYSIWPKPIAHIIMKFYSKSMESNKI